MPRFTICIPSKQQRRRQDIPKWQPIYTTSLERGFGMKIFGFPRTSRGTIWKTKMMECIYQRLMPFIMDSRSPLCCWWFDILSKGKCTHAETMCRACHPTGTMLSRVCDEHLPILKFLPDESPSFKCNNKNNSLSTQDEVYLRNLGSHA